MKVSMIAAMGSNREIGFKNDLLWHLPADMKFFKEITLGHCVIMGRKNYESIPEKYRPFDNRTNIVISRDSTYQAPGCYVVPGIPEALAMAKAHNETEAFIIGGAQIYRLALMEAKIDRIYLTQVEAAFPHADTFFPLFDEDAFTKTQIGKHAPDAKHKYGFTIFEYSRR